MELKLLCSPCFQSCDNRNLCAYCYLAKDLFLLELQLTHFLLYFVLKYPLTNVNLSSSSELSESCANVSCGTGCSRQANHKHTGKKIVMVCTLQSSPSPRGQVDSGFFQSTMKIQRGQDFHHVLHSVFDEMDRVT